MMLCFLLLWRLFWFLFQFLRTVQLDRMLIVIQHDMESFAALHTPVIHPILTT